MSSIVITDLPDYIDPIVLIEKRVKTCPICGSSYNKQFCPVPQTEYMDKKGKYHKIFKFKNKYLWKQYRNLICGNPSCKCRWDTGWYPADYEMFKITVKNKDIVKDFVNSFNEVRKEIEK